MQEIFFGYSFHNHNVVRQRQNIIYLLNSYIIYFGRLPVPTHPTSYKLLHTPIKQAVK